MDAAHDAAHAQVKVWTRLTLWEVALQGLRQATRVNDDNELILDDVALARVKKLCCRVADQWSQTLIEASYPEAGQWVQHVLHEGLGTLFYRDDGQPEENVTEDSPAMHASLPQPANNNATNTTNVMQQEPVELVEPMTAYARLRQVGRSTLRPPATCQVDHDVLAAEIHHLGQQRLTDWPYDWSLVQRSAQELRPQHHKAVKIVPRSVWEQQERREDKQADMEDYLIRRRRRKPQPKPPKRPKPSRPPSPVEMPRAPSNQEGWKWGDDKLTASDREHLDRNYLVTDRLPLPASHATLMGPMRDLAHFHFAQQRDIDNLQWSRSFHITRAMNERLGDHTIEQKQATRPRGAASRAALTVDPYRRRWIDADLGNAMLDRVENGDHKLYAMGSVELMLLDEDKTGGDDQSPAHPSPAENDVDTDIS